MAIEHPHVKVQEASRGPSSANRWCSGISQAWAEFVRDIEK